jgi:cell fate (sporulation/competence/biofilm development) regulator YlbF (YheA/YmcA/DUF963 family)
LNVPAFYLRLNSKTQKAIVVDEEECQTSFGQNRQNGVQPEYKAIHFGVQIGGNQIAEIENLVCYMNEHIKMAHIPIFSVSKI